MVCGGQNSTCLHHKSVYQSNGLQAGRTHARTHAHTHTISVTVRNRLLRFQTTTTSRHFQAVVTHSGQK